MNSCWYWNWYWWYWKGIWMVYRHGLYIPCLYHLWSKWPSWMEFYRTIDGIDDTILPFKMSIPIHDKTADEWFIELLMILKLILILMNGTTELWEKKNDTNSVGLRRPDVSRKMYGWGHWGSCELQDLQVGFWNIHVLEPVLWTSRTLQCRQIRTCRKPERFEVHGFPFVLTIICCIGLYETARNQTGLCQG